jgi:hypothetical protein
MHVLAASAPSVWAQPGTLGFLVVFGMGVVLFFVFRSMSRHLRKVREAAEREAEQVEQAGAGDQGDVRGPGVDRLPTTEYDQGQSEANAAVIDLEH